MEGKNVLHIITVSFVINHFFGNQFLYLKTLSNNSYYLACSPSPELHQLSKKLGYIPTEINITRNISPFLDIKAIFLLYRFIKKNNIKTVVGHTPKGGMVAMIAANLAGVNQRIYFRHGIIYETSSGIKRFLLKNIDRLSGNLSTKVVCVSNSVKKISILDKLNDPQKNIVLGLGTCNGIDTEEKFNPQNVDPTIVNDLRNKYNLTEGDFVIGYVGRLVRDKGINELVAAFLILQSKYKKCKLLLVGPLEDRDSITDYTKKEIQSNDSILHTGFVLDSAPYFKIMNVFVLPTYREGFPTVALEASSMELPVLITRATGCEESIIDKTTGVFITHDTDDIVESVSFFIDNPNSEIQLGLNGRKFVREKFKNKQIWDEINKELHY